MTNTCVIMVHKCPLFFSTLCCFVCVRHMSKFICFTKRYFLRKKGLHFNGASSLDSLVVILFTTAKLTNLLNHFDMKPSAQHMEHHHLLGFKGAYGNQQEKSYTNMRMYLKSTSYSNQII